MKATPRLRMFAGPNGSGKSTLNEVLPPELLGIYVNPDSIEKNLKQHGFIDFSTFQIQTTASEVLANLNQSTLLNKAHLSSQTTRLSWQNNCLHFGDVIINSYWASALSDFIRHKLLDAKISFTFETVMSSKDKVAFLAKARAAGFRTYLYYVATADPAINISRVAHRVKMGGHAVPEEKIVARYHRSLELLSDAVHQSDRAYIFDNSSQDRLWLAEATDGIELKLVAAEMPHWFAQALWNKFDAEELDT